jgi:hypothetical protein
VAAAFQAGRSKHWIKGQEQEASGDEAGGVCFGFVEGKLLAQDSTLLATATASERLREAAKALRDSAATPSGQFSQACVASAVAKTSRRALAKISHR